MEFFKTLFEFDFLLVAIGTMILSAATAAVGTISVLKEQSLIGDAVSHAAYPGIILAFIFFKVRDPIVLTLGAAISGSFAFFLIQFLHDKGKIKLDTLLAIVLSSLFGLGLALNSYVATANLKGASQAGLADYIFGQAAYMMKKDVYLIITVALISITLFIAFYKEIKVFIFDSVYAETIGIKSSFIYSLILIMTMVLIASGIKIVGAVLISSLLIAPGITGLLWSDKFKNVLLIAALTGGISAFIGTFFSASYKGFSTGPSIIVVMSVICIGSLLISPRGIFNILKNRNQNLKNLSKKGGK